MKKKTKKSRLVHSDEPIGKLTSVTDFLPSPEELVASEKMVKITIVLDEPTVEFFKSEADKQNAKYQKMMREVLKRYAKKFSRSA